MSGQGAVELVDPTPASYSQWVLGRMPPGTHLIADPTTKATAALGDYFPESLIIKAKYDNCRA